jgi:tetratricopeptide (TPR) repeat protein
LTTGFLVKPIFPGGFLGPGRTTAKPVPRKKRNYKQKKRQHRITNELRMKTRENKSGTDAHEWYRKGCRLKRAGNLRAAVKSFSKAIDCDTQFAKAYFTRGASFYLLGQYRRAGMDMDAAVLLGCQDAQLWSRFDMHAMTASDEDEDA